MNLCFIGTVCCVLLQSYAALNYGWRFGDFFVLLTVCANSLRGQSLAPNKQTQHRVDRFGQLLSCGFEQTTILPNKESSQSKLSAYICNVYSEILQNVLKPTQWFGWNFEKQLAFQAKTPHYVFFTNTICTIYCNVMLLCIGCYPLSCPLLSRLYFMDISCTLPFSIISCINNVSDKWIFLQEFLHFTTGITFM